MATQTKRLSIRIEEEELALLKEAAWRRKTSLSHWTRSILLANARRTIETVEPPK